MKARKGGLLYQQTRLLLMLLGQAMLCRQSDGGGRFNFGLC